ncbi:MAG: hypothetical protein ACREFX_14980 [Opitutaceae bacterium]
MNLKHCLILAGFRLCGGCLLAVARPAPKAPAPVGLPPVLAAPPPTAPDVFRVTPNLLSVPRSIATGAGGVLTLSDRQYRDLQQEVTAPPLAERRALYTEDIAHHARLNAIGPIIKPIRGETEGERQQVRISLLSVTW